MVSVRHVVIAVHVEEDARDNHHNEKNFGENEGAHSGHGGESNHDFCYYHFRVALLMSQSVQPDA